MKRRTQDTVSVLVGLPLWSVGRAADLAWFAFGGRRTVKDWQGQEKEVGDYALHVQCPWRITLGDSIVVGRGDIFCTPEETQELIRDGFDWQAGNRFDKLVPRLFRNESRPFIVKAVEAGDAGTLTIDLEDDYRLQLFPNDSESGEHWRFFKPYSDDQHFVMTGELSHEG